MKIGILGAPGAGKSKFARDLARLLEKDHPKHHVIDGYVQRLSKKTNLALGHWASYPEHFMIAGIRQAEESRFEHTITAGTIIDSLLYCAMHSDTDISARMVKELAYTRANAAMNALALWYGDGWRYDYVFHLPYTDKVREEKAGTWDLIFDQELPAQIQALQVPAYTITNPLDRAKLATEVIQIVETEKLHPKESADESSIVERGIRQGSESG